MNSLFAGTPYERKLLPEGRLSGPMPWVIAIVILLTILAAAASLSLTRASAAIGSEIAGRVSVQVINANPENRAAQVRAIKRTLDATNFVRAVRPVDDVQIASMMERWLGKDAQELGLPVPALVDVDLVGAADADTVGRLRTAVVAVAPDAWVEPHANWLGPVSRLIGSFAVLAAGLVLLLALATAAIVTLTARSALNVNHATIELLHLIGATDVQIARLFQRRLALDAAFGGILGAVAALIVMLVVGAQFRDLGAALMANATLGWGWIVVAVIPLLLIALASITARLTITSALRRIL